MSDAATRTTSVSHDKYDRLIAAAQKETTIKVAVAHPCDEVSLRGVVEATNLRLVDPILVGPVERVRAVAAQSNIDISAIELVNSEHSEDSAAKAVRLVTAGKVEALMKGSLHTDELMSAVVSRQSGIRTARRISHCFIMDVPGYSEPLIITDAAVNIAPDLDAKVDIIQNAIDLAHAMGLAEVRVAILSAMETVTAKVPSTIEAAALCKMAERGQITGALLDGPLALDNAISPEAAAIKKIASPVAGRANVLVVPDLEAGNMLAKSLSFLAQAESAGIVLGRACPDYPDKPRQFIGQPPRVLRRGGHGRCGATQVRARRNSLKERSMGDDTLRPVLAGQKALVIGVANNDSIAYGCAKAFRATGADLAITWLNEKARPYVEPLARELGASITGAVDVAVPGQLEAMFDQNSHKMGSAGHSRSLNRLRAQERSSGRTSELFRGRVREGDGYFVPFLHSNGEAGGAPDDRRRDDVRHELLRREPGGRELQCDGSGQGSARGGVPLSGLRTRFAGHPRARHVSRSVEDAGSLGPEGLRTPAE